MAPSNSHADLRFQCLALSMQVLSGVRVKTAIEMSDAVMALAERMIDFVIVPATGKATTKASLHAIDTGTRN